MSDRGVAYPRVPGARLVQDAPRYARSTDKAVEYYTVIDDTFAVTGYLWFCEADGAAGFEERKAGDNFNAASFWNGMLFRCREQGLSPTQAAERLLAEPGSLTSGRARPESRAVANTLGEVKALAEEGWTPPKKPVPPPGWRPAPPVSPEIFEQATAAGGWLYQVDDGHDPDGRVPPHAVRGAWHVTEHGEALYWNNPAYAIADEPAQVGEASPLPPLRAGRRPAGAALLGWLEDTQAPRLCRIAGSSGTGRTYLLSWLAAACPPDNPRRARRLHVLLPAEGLTVRSATWMLADRLGLTARTPDDLMAALQDGVPRAIAITDLDRAGDLFLPDMPERIVRELLAPLLRVPWLRIVVEAESDGPALAALRAAAPREAVMDLDEAQWTDPERFASWCAALGGYPVPAGQVYPSPGLAQLAARTAAKEDLDPRSSLTGRAASLSTYWLNSLPDEAARALGALARAGRPLTGEVWAALPGSGGPEAVGRAVRYLPPPTDGRTWRLTPVQLAATVTSSADDFDVFGSDGPDFAAFAHDLTAILPRTPDGRPDFGATDPELLGLLLRHSLLAGTAHPLLADPAFVSHADPATVTAALEYTQPGGRFPLPEHVAEANFRKDLFGPGYTSPVERPQSPLAKAWDAAGPACISQPAGADRAGTLHAWLLGLDRTAAGACPAVPGRGRPVAWALWRGRPQRVRWVTAGRGLFADRLMVTVNGALRCLDPRTGREVTQPPPSRMPENDEVAVTCAEDGRLVLLRRDGTLTQIPYPGEMDRELGDAGDWAARNFSGLTAIGTLGGAADRVLATGDGAGRLAWLDLRNQDIEVAAAHRGPVTALDTVRTSTGALVLSGGHDGRVCRWQPGHGPAVEEIDARDRPITALAAADTPHGHVIATAWADGLIRLHRPDAAHPVTDLRLGPAAHSLAVDPSGTLCIGLPEAVFGVALD